MDFQQILDTFRSGDFLLGMFQLIMGVIMVIVNAILWPFGLLIKQYMPDLDAGLNQLGEYFELAGSHMGWVLNAFAVPALAVTMVATYYLFAFSTTFAAWTVKLVIKWKQALWG